MTGHFSRNVAPCRPIGQKKENGDCPIAVPLNRTSCPEAVVCDLFLSLWPAGTRATGHRPTFDLRCNNSDLIFQALQGELRMGSPTPNGRDATGLLRRTRFAGNKADRREPSQRSGCGGAGRLPGRGLRLADIGDWSVPKLAAGRWRLFPWDGSLRSALFPRKESPATCLQRWSCEGRFSIFRK
jgi:hypothetical protein